MCTEQLVFMILASSRHIGSSAMAIGATINFLLSPLGLCIGRTNSPDRAPTIELDPRTGTDDYDWQLYHLDYSAQIAAIAKTSTTSRT
jgi:hypothetical protein